MRQRVGIFETLGRHMRIDLRGRKIRVPQKLLNAPEIRSAIKHVRRERMTERMRRNLFPEAGPLHIFHDHAPDTPVRKTAPDPADKKGLFNRVRAFPWGFHVPIRA